MGLEDMQNVKIETTSSGEGLKEEIIKIANRRYVRWSSIVIQVYEFAVENPSVFPNGVDEPRPKGGKHIAVKVSKDIAKSLLDTARSLNRSRSAHCCMLLEAFVNDKKLQSKILDGK